MNDFADGLRWAIETIDQEIDAIEYERHGHGFNPIHIDGELQSLSAMRGVFQGRLNSVSLTGRSEWQNHWNGTPGYFWVYRIGWFGPEMFYIGLDGTLENVNTGSVKGLDGLFYLPCQKPSSLPK